MRYQYSGLVQRCQRRRRRLTKMVDGAKDAGPSKFHVKATFCLASETYSVNTSTGTLSEQLVSVKEESMSILKSFITKHNISIDVPDEPLEGSEDDDSDEITEKPPKKQK